MIAYWAELISKEEEVESHRAIRLALEARLRELARRVDDLEADLRQPLDPDFAEQAVDLQDDESLAALEDAGRTEIVRIRAALARIDDGTWGTCETCGDDIAQARLTALPTATQCAGCAAAATKAHR